MQTHHGHSRSKSSTFLSRLASDRSGNVFIITAAAIFPMLGVIGGAVDMSRLYLVKSRVQSACDSAVLAGRKAMTTNTYTAAARTRANSMFRFNFQDSDYGTSNTSFNSSADAQGKLTGVAATTVPMALMQVFGFEDESLNVTCSADVQVPNIDVVFVLDVTGSMNDPIGGVKKIDSLKVAAKDFVATMEASMAGNTRSQLRYGFVPYSQTVNGSALFRPSPDTTQGQLSTSHLANTMTAESRVANFNTPVQDFVPDATFTPVTINQTFNNSNNNTKQPFLNVTASGTNISNVDCGDYAANLSMDISGVGNVHLFPLTSWPGSSGQGHSVLFQAEGSNNWVTSEPSNSNSYRRMTFSRVSATWSDNGGANTAQYRNCVRQVRQERMVKRTRYKFTNWTYQATSFDVSRFKNGEALQYVSDIAATPEYLVDTISSYNPQQLRRLTNQTGLTSASTTWNGCLEERGTVAATNFAPIPANARDLNFLDGGTSDLLRWPMSLLGRNLTYDRQRTGTLTGSGLAGTHSDVSNFTSQSCPPVSMRNLNVMSRTEANTYIDSLGTAGSTYHDIGMVWGLRMISAQGMFASRNLVGANGGQISRHIIFLTDGQMEPRENTYSSYGMERTSRRVMGSTGVGQTELHNRRFQALCDAQRGAVSIWVVGFGTTVTGNLTSCADPGRAFPASNQTELQNAFRNIARDIADLRLVQ